MAGLTSACQSNASSGPPASESSPPGSPTTVTASPTADASAAASGPAFEIPILEDAEFRTASTERCAAVRPATAGDLSAPLEPSFKALGYDGLHIVVLEQLDASGTAVPAPPLPEDDAYYHAADAPVSLPGSTEALPVEAEFASEVDLLACVVLRSGTSASYSGDSGDITVTALDAVVWFVDPATGALVGAPWLTTAELGMLINLDVVLRVGSSRLLPADIRPAIAYAMALAQPLGGAYQGGAGGYVVAEYDAPADLPPGTRLLSGYTFVVRLVVLPDSSSTIDFIDILCAANGSVLDPPLRVATEVPHDLGRFSAASSDVEIDGDFQSEWLVAGSIRALSTTARDCGVPGSADWQAALALQARRDGSGYVLVP